MHDRCFVLALGVETGADVATDSFIVRRKGDSDGS